MIIEEDIILNAEALRRSWNVDNVSPLNILPTVLEMIENLTILWFPMLDELSGCCAKNGEDYVICLNSKHSKGRQNFTIAHELYHLLYEDDRDSFVCNVNSDEESEKNADKFAESLLMPNIALQEFINKNKISRWDLEDIIKCEQYFQISHTAMLCKLRRRKMIGYDEFKRFRSNVKRKAWDLGYDLDLYESTRMNYCLGKIIPLSKALFNEKKITGGKFDEILLDVFRQDMVYNTLEGDDGFV